jgi:hypothetical protein
VEELTELPLLEMISLEGSVGLSFHFIHRLCNLIPTDVSLLLYAFCVCVVLQARVLIHFIYMVFPSLHIYTDTNLFNYIIDLNVVPYFPFLFLLYLGPYCKVIPTFCPIYKIEFRSDFVMGIFNTIYLKNI